MWYEVILDSISNNPLGLDQVLLVQVLSLISLWNWNLFTYVRVQLILFQDQVDPIFPSSEVIISLNIFITIGVMRHLNSKIQMEIQNI